MKLDGFTLLDMYGLERIPLLGNLAVASSRTFREGLEAWRAACGKATCVAIDGEQQLAYLLRIVERRVVLNLWGLEQTP
jgi:hypothetical protein